MSIKSMVTVSPLTPDLEEQLVAIESRFGDNFTVVLDRIVDKLSMFADIANILKINNPTIDSFHYPKRNMDKKLKEYDYFDLTATTAYRPVGMGVNYRIALEALADAQGEVLTIEKRMVKPFIKWSGKALTKPETLANLNQGMPFETIDAKEINDKLDALFSTDSTSDECKYEQVLENNSQWDDIVKNLNNVIDNQNKLSSKKMTGLLNDCVKRADLLVKRIRENPEKYAVSAASKEKLSQLVFRMAEEFTLYSRLNFIITSLARSINDTVKKIESMG